MTNLRGVFSLAGVLYTNYLYIDYLYIELEGKKWLSGLFIISVV